MPGSEAYGMVTRLVPTPRTTVTWSADVRVIAGPATETLELLEIYDTGGPFWALYLALDPTGIAITEEYTPDGGGGQSKTTDITTAALGVNQWHRVSISADFANKSFVARIDGVSVAAGALMGARPAPTLKLSPSTARVMPSCVKK